MRALIRFVAVAALFSGAAWAHGGHGHSEPPGWTLDPWIITPLLLTVALFAGGWLRLYGRSSSGRTTLRARAWLFAIGWLTLAGALVSPLHEAGERSFTAHMLEHELLMLLAAPLLVLSEPLAVMLWAFPGAARRIVGQLATARPIAGPFRALTGAVTATFIQAAVLWIWHMPSLFYVALANEGWHATQHLCFIVSALLFWTAMLGRHGAGASTAPDRMLAAFCLVVTSVITGALGALMAFSDSPWYAGYARLALGPFGLTPAEDQQLAGLLMWVPGGLVHLVAGLALFRSVLVPQRSANAL